MEIDLNLDHLHHWMCAIRESKDPMRTLDAFWKGQMDSKEWLMDQLYEQRNHSVEWPTIEIHGGWVGVLASLFFQSNMYIEKIISIDIDPECETTANRMNQMEYQAGRFKAITADMCSYSSHADIIINTSCEHIAQEQYDSWLDKLPHTSLLVLQSNNYKIPEHVRTAETLDQFKQQCHLCNVLWAGELDLPLYKRWMVIGKK